MALAEFPEVGENVICKIRRIQNYGAFCELVEYGKEGFIHISQVATTWIKNIRNHVHEGQIRVGKVTRIDTTKGMIDVSLRKVTKDQERKKTNEWKRDKRAQNLIKIIAKRLGKDPEKSFREIGKKLSKHFHDLFAGFEEAREKGAKGLEGIVPPEWAKEIEHLAKENVTVSTIQVGGKLKLSVPTGNGLDVIKKAIGSVDKNIHVSYISAPTYQIKTESTDPREAEENLAKNVEKIKTMIEEAGGSFAFTKTK